MSVVLVYRMVSLSLLSFLFLFLRASAVLVAGPLEMFTRTAFVECLALIALSGEWLWGVLSGVGSSMSA